MSNMIKAYSVRYDQVGSKTIDSQLKVEHQMFFNHKAKEVNFQEGGFVEGINATIVEVIDLQEEVKENAIDSLENAKEKADQILEEARLEAQRMKKEAFAQGKEQGLEAGKLESEKKIQLINRDFKDKEKQLHLEYQELVAKMEPQMADLLASLLEKMTGILCENHKDVIHHLIKRSLKNIDKSKEYVIKVSKEDYENVLSQKAQFLEEIGREIELSVIEMNDLQKNQCIIETDYAVVNCSLDLQMKNLVTQLKLLSIEV